jgi:glycosidase
VCDEIDPDCLLVGEMIHGNYNNWVGNDRLHSGTNYQLSRAIWNCLNEANYDELMTAMLRESKLYSGITLLNFLGNHDVARIASSYAGPSGPSPSSVAPGKLSPSWVTINQLLAGEGGYTYDVGVWDSSIVQGPKLLSRRGQRTCFDSLNFASLYAERRGGRGGIRLKEPGHYKLATAHMMLLPGVPCLYYRDHGAV